MVLPLVSGAVATKWTSNLVGVEALVAVGATVTALTAVEGVPIV